MDERETINQLSKKAGAGAGGRDSGDDECGFGGSQEPEWSPTRADGTTHSCIAREATPKCGAECDGVCASFRAREVVEAGGALVGGIRRALALRILRPRHGQPVWRPARADFLGQARRHVLAQVRLKLYSR